MLIKRKRNALKMILTKRKDYINNVSKKTATEIWEKEIDKNLVANQNGYKVFTIWETDYNKDKQKCITQCLEFLSS